MDRWAAEAGRLAAWNQVRSVRRAELENRAAPFRSEKVTLPFQTEREARPWKLSLRSKPGGSLASTAIAR